MTTLQLSIVCVTIIVLAVLVVAVIVGSRAPKGGSQ